MVGFTELPVDIIYEISSYLNLKDICTIRRASSVLNYKVNSVKNNIISNELRRSCKSYGHSVDIRHLHNLFYNFLNYNLVTFLYKFRRKNVLFNNIHYLRNYLMCYSYDTYRMDLIEGITSNPNINLLFDKIFYYYVYTNHSHLSSYPNKLELCALYNFLQIEIFQNKHDFDYWLDFLQSLNKSLYFDVIFKYYSSTLDTYHTHNVCLTFDKMYKMSSIVASIPVIKKILGYRILDLSNTKLNMCCMGCNESNIFDICQTKFSYYKDDLISYNYLQFKDFLKKENLYYYTVLTNRETFLVNTMVYVKNPITNRRMRLNGNVYKQFIRSMESDKHSNKYYVGVLRYIYKQQKLLKNRYFT